MDLTIILHAQPFRVGGSCRVSAKIPYNQLLMRAKTREMSLLSDAMCVRVRRLASCSC